MSKYFLDRHGNTTQRLQSRPGMPHYDIATMVLGVNLKNDEDFYEQMARHGYVRCLEDSDTMELQVDSRGRGLSGPQRKFLMAKQAEGFTVHLNSREFVESRDKVSLPVQRVLGG